MFAAVFAVGALLLLSTGGGPAVPVAQTPTPTPSATSGTPTAAPKKNAVTSSQGNTVLEVRFTGDCEGCLVTAAQTDEAGGQQDWTATITDSVAQLELPTPNTYGMYLTVKGTTNGVENGSQQLVLLAPEGIKPGQPVEASDLRDAKAAGVCWAGTTLDTAVLRMQIAAKDGQVTQTWADPALPTFGDRVEVKKSGSAKPDCS